MTGSRAALRGADLEQLAARIREVARDREALDVSQFQFVDLGSIRKAYGERWPAEHERIHEVAERYIARRTGPRDVLVRGANGFLIVFESLDTAQAEAATRELAAGLNQFFLGEGKVPTAKVTGERRTLPTSSLVSGVWQAGDAPAPDPSWEEGAPPGSDDLDWIFQPSWDVKHETLSGWYATPRLKESGARIPGYHFEPNPAPSSTLAATDEAAIAVADRGLQNLIASGRQALIGHSVHVGSMTSVATRGRLLPAIDKLNASLHRYRVVKIAAIPPGFPRLYLNDIVGVLKSRLPNVVIGCSWDDPDIPGLLSSGVAGLGFTLPAALVEGAAAQLVFSKVSEAVALAHASRARLFIEGLLAANTVRRLAALGVDNIASPVIWPPQPGPAGMQKCPLNSLAA